MKKSLFESSQTTKPSPNNSSVSHQLSAAPCDARVEGLMTYCNYFIGSGGQKQIVSDSFLVGFRVVDPTGGIYNVVALTGNATTNRGKYVDNIATQNEPNFLTIHQINIAGGALDTAEYWYFGPFANNDSFNIVLVDPMNMCDTIPVAAGRYSCQDNATNQSISDPAACDADVPLYFLDFSQSTFTVGGGGSSNEDFDEVFLIMARTRETSCCDIGNSVACFEFVVILGENDIGLAIDDVGSGSTGGSIYGDSLVNFVCNPGNNNNVSTDTWPFQVDNGQSNDFPLCLSGSARKFVILSCKPGGNVTSASIDAISGINSTPQATVEPCDVELSVSGADSASWRSLNLPNGVFDPALANLNFSSSDSLSAAFLYDTTLFPQVTSCFGDTFFYEVAAMPLSGGCLTIDTLIRDTTYVVVYPIFNISLAQQCTQDKDSVFITATIEPGNIMCNFDYAWSNGDSVNPIKVPAENAVMYSVTVTRPEVASSFAYCNIISDTITIYNQAFINCDSLLPKDTLIQCLNDTLPRNPGLIKFDGCYSVVPAIMVDHTYSNNRGCIGDTLIVSRYYIVDYDGNFNDAANRDTCTQLFRVVDNIPPDMAILPADTIVNCNVDTSALALGMAMAGMDNCTVNVLLNRRDSIVPGICPAIDTIFRIWVSSDSCGNSISQVQRITRIDTIPPNISCPIDLTINCPGDTSVTAMGNGLATATDLCDLSPTISYRDSVVAGSCAKTFTIHRIWEATDDCNNQSRCIQRILFQDTIPPVISCPVDLTVSCKEDTLVSNTGIAMAMDLCDGSVPNIVYMDMVTPGSCENNILVMRTWIATDSCGNSRTCVQTISVMDTMRPILICALDTTINCGTDTSALAIGMATATDNCTDSVTNIVWSDVITAGSCVDNYTITRTWIATDSCGNSASCVQTITVQDTMRPILVCALDTTINCGTDTSALAIGMATATD
ncbi:MAG: hypothetical protein KDC49_16410, partial [Saprospiraceae bacterium]|nr:hypothetical protein [Saprospiraceae bacterium]